MNDDSLSLAAALLRHLNAPEEAKDDTFWAWETVQDMIDRGDTEPAWAAIRQAIDISTTPRELILLGAGVLESLLTESDVTSVLTSILAEAEHDPKVIAALTVANLTDAADTVRSAITDVLRQSRR